MICPNQSNRGPLKELKCGSLPTADIVGAVGKNDMVAQVVEKRFHTPRVIGSNLQLVAMPIVY